MANPHDSIYVAPLNIRKPSVSPEGDGQHGNGLALTTDVSGESANLDFDEIMNQELDSPPVFQSFLRAFYPFQPTASLSPSTVTLPLNTGDIVLVHSIHTNGWADGTLLETGARGWLPTNYCEPYEHVHVRPLLRALTDFWDIIRSGAGTSAHVFRNQDYMRGLIAGVRFLLEKTDCLTRDSGIVQRHNSIRRTRKSLLSDLSLLVKVAKRLQDLASGPRTHDAFEDVLDNMLLKAFRIVTRAVSFLDVWSDEVDSDRLLAHASTSNTPSPQQSPPQPSSQAVVTGSIFPPRPFSDVDRRLSRGNQALPTFRSRDHEATSPTNVRMSRHLSMGSPPSANPARPISLQGKRRSITHRMSYTAHVGGRSPLNLASEKVSSSYDVFLGVLASFLGSHMQSRSSSELLLSTQQAVKSCRELLSTIEIVLDRDMRRSEVLLEAKDSMYDKITELVHAAREVFRPIHSGDDEMIYLPEEGKALVNAATACVRGAGECVAKTKLVLEEIGDFELDDEPSRDSIALGTEPESTLGSTLGSFADSNDTTSLFDDQTTQMDSGAPVPSFAQLPRLEIPHTPLTPFSPPNTLFSSVSVSTPGSSVGPPSALPLPNAVAEGSPDPAWTSLAGDIGFPTSGDVPHDVQIRRQKSVARTIINSTGSDSTYLSSTRHSGGPSTVSPPSTRASSLDEPTNKLLPDIAVDEQLDVPLPQTDDLEDTEAKLLAKTYAHELMFNKEGQVIGGSLPALIEKLTAHDSTPDALFVTTFYLTFRLFTSPKAFAEALVDRFDYIGETSRVSNPVRLRVYNVFKGWLESHWRHDCDDIALPLILDFTRQTLTPLLPTAGKRLEELADKVGLVHGPLVPRLLSSIGKTNTAMQVHSDTPMPPPIISKSQLASLRTWKMGGAGVSILDFDAMELARQITLKVSSIFCSILPEELLATEWMKTSGSLAVNVRAMSTLSTDLTNLVADSILQNEEPKKRAALIKQWVKISKKCLKLHNYDALMAIICSLNSSTILRLKKTWDAVSQKTKTTLEELKRVVDISRNYVALRQRLQGLVPPCLPFVGIYLTDLTFVGHGNPMTRQLPTEDGPKSVINYDKHMKTARIISELQRFQIPYRFTEVPELQTWMQDQLVRVRSVGEKSFQNHYRRSLILEPREANGTKPSPVVATPKEKEKDRFDFLAWTHPTKDKSIASNG